MLCGVNFAAIVYLVAMVANLGNCRPHLAGVDGAAANVESRHRVRRNLYPWVNGPIVARTELSTTTVAAAANPATSQKSVEIPFTAPDETAEPTVPDVQLATQGRKSTTPEGTTGNRVHPTTASAAQVGETTGANIIMKSTSKSGPVAATAPSSTRASTTSRFTSGLEAQTEKTTGAVEASKKSSNAPDSTTTTPTTSPTSSTASTTSKPAQTEKVTGAIEPNTENTNIPTKPTSASTISATQSSSAPVNGSASAKPTSGIPAQATASATESTAGSTAFFNPNEVQALQIGPDDPNVVDEESDTGAMTNATKRPTTSSTTSKSGATTVAESPDATASASGEQPGTSSSMERRTTAEPEATSTSNDAQATKEQTPALPPTAKANTTTTSPSTTTERAPITQKSQTAQQTETPSKSSTTAEQRTSTRNSQVTTTAVTSPPSTTTTQVQAGGDGDVFVAYKISVRNFAIGEEEEPDEPAATQTTNEDENGRCPTGFVLIDDETCYYAMTAELNWWQAADACRQLHADASLVDINSYREQNAVLAMSALLDADTCPSHWTAGQRVRLDHPRPHVVKFVWKQRTYDWKLIYRYINWGYRDSELLAGDCLYGTTAGWSNSTVGVHEGTWGAAPCADLKCVICELPLSQTISTDD